MVAPKLQNTRCPHCEHVFGVRTGEFGKRMYCPQCKKDFVIAPWPPRGAKAQDRAQATRDAPLKKEGQKAQAAKADRINAKCANCGAQVVVTKAAAGKKAKCPRCQQVATMNPVVDRQVELEVSASTQSRLDSKAVHLSDEQLQTFTAMKELEESRKDPYWLILLKALKYPFDALGALLFFVTGIPIVIAICEVAAVYALREIGASESVLESPDKQRLLAAGVSALSMAPPLAMLSFFCSFVIAAVRVSTEGRTSMPVVSGMKHRSNLAAICAWAAMYFGPAVLVGYLAREPGMTFNFTHPLVILLALAGAIMAPMGLLCAATESASGALNLGLVGKCISKVAQPYFQALGVCLLGIGLFGLAAYLVNVQAAETGSNLLRGVLGVVFYLLLSFPVIIVARAMGVMAKYHGAALPFTPDIFASSKAGSLPQLMALAGVAVLFMPIWEGAEGMLGKGLPALKAKRQMEAIAAKLGSGTGGTGRTHPDTWEAMEAKVGKDLLGCPLTAEEREAYPDGEAMAQYPFYAVPDWPAGKALPREIPQNFLMLYEKHSAALNANQGERASVNVLRRADAPIDLRIRDVKTLLELMYRWAAAEDDADRLDAEKKYSSAMGMALARR